MIAKLAVWGRTRTEAIDRLRRALDEYDVGGITTTLPFFRRVVCDDEFIAGNLDTGFITRFNAREEATEPQPLSSEETDMATIAAALYFLKQQSRTAPSTTSAAISRWKMSGRAAALANRQPVSSEWRKS
jgi:acetyl/propionyl-CoA carboxylase alpha subunit